MRHFKNILMITVMVLTSASAFAGKKANHMIKTEREDFSAIIAEGVESQKELRKELRENVGLPDLDKHWAKDMKAKGRTIVGTTEGEDIVAPTTKYVRKEVRPKAANFSEERLANEFRALEN